MNKLVLMLNLGAVATALALPTPIVRPLGRPDALVDLRTVECARLVRAEWRYADARIVDTEGRAPDADLRPSDAAVRTYDYEPKAGAAGFDDRDWPVIEPAALEARRGSGKVSFGWYRTGITIPERIGRFDPTGSTVVFEVVVDDYAEVWIDGRLAPALGQTGGGVAAGFNAPNRVVVGRDVRPGQRIEIAVFAVNGPVSASPANFIWVRSATLDFFGPSAAESVGRVVRVDPALDAIVPAAPRIERLATGFLFAEGPVWVRDGGYLLFSDPNDNRIYRWTPDGELSVFRTKSGYSGSDIAEYGQPGSNGLTLDREGRLTIDEHGNRRVTRLERNGQLTVLADRYEGKRLNSPNDLVYRSDGSLYFTDPPFGLPEVFDDPRKELPYSGVYHWNGGTLRLVARNLTGPNGIALSPDEEVLYVANWDLESKVVMRYRVQADGALSDGEVFFDMTSEEGEIALDGLKVDQRGNVYVSGPGGVWIISPSGTHLGTIVAPELPANFAWGDADGRTLYLAARTSLYRIRLDVPGVRP